MTPILQGDALYWAPAQWLRSGLTPLGSRAAPHHVSQFLNSVAGPQFHIERGFAPRPAFPSAQLPLKRDEAGIAWPPLLERRIRDDGLVRAGVTAGAHQVEGAQILEAEGVARRHRRACSFLPPIV